MRYYNITLIIPNLFRMSNRDLISIVNYLFKYL